MHQFNCFQTCNGLTKVVNIAVSINRFTDFNNLHDLQSVKQLHFLREDNQPAYHRRHGLKYMNDRGILQLCTNKTRHIRDEVDDNNDEDDIGDGDNVTCSSDSSDNCNVE